MLWRKGKAHGQDLRERVFAAADGGSGVCEIARRLFVSVSYVSKVLARRRQTGEIAARPRRCHVPAKLAAYRDRIAERVAAFPDATLEELKTWLLAACGVEASTTLIWETLDRLDLTFKKKIVHAAEQDRPDVAEARRVLREEQPKLNPAKLVFIDETFTKTNMLRLRGRSKRGERLIDKTPHGHWKTSTFIAALRHDRLTAPFVIDGPVNGELFLEYVRQVLVPTPRDGDIVAMDNLGSHKVSGVREAIEAAGARVMYLPAYSPDP